MKELGKWQIISFISRGLATLIGIAQSFVIIRILSVSDWGVIQLASAIGGALGIYQHLGLASASTREIASAKDDGEVFKIFLTSVVIRYVVTLPLALGLYFFADKVAVGIYKNSLLILPLKIYAITLLFQGFQSIFNSIISGTKRFKRLFIYQVFVAVLGLFLYLPLIHFYKVNGYFYAYLSFNIINSVLLAYLSLAPLRGKLKLPTKKDFSVLFKDIFSISIAIYFVKILATNWEKIGPNILGLHEKPEMIAIFAFAMLYARKILSISDSVTDVTLPVFTEKYVTDIEDFKNSFKQNFDKIFGFIILTSTLACFWAPQIISLLVGGSKYAQSYKFIPSILLAYVVYSCIDIVKSSVYVPAKFVKEMILSYFILLVTTVIFFYYGTKYTNDLSAMSNGLAVGSIFSLLYVIYSLHKKLKYRFFNISHWAVLFQASLIGWFGVNVDLKVKTAMFLPLLVLLAVGLLYSKIFTKKDFEKIIFAWKRPKVLL